MGKNSIQLLSRPSFKLSWALHQHFVKVSLGSSVQSSVGLQLAWIEIPPICFLDASRTHCPLKQLSDKTNKVLERRLQCPHSIQISEISSKRSSPSLSCQAPLACFPWKMPQIKWCENCSERNERICFLVVLVFIVCATLMPQITIPKVWQNVFKSSESECAACNSGSPSTWQQDRIKAPALGKLMGLLFKPKRCTSQKNICTQMHVCG